MSETNQNPEAALAAVIAADVKGATTFAEADKRLAVARQAYEQATGQH